MADSKIEYQTGRYAVLRPLLDAEHSAFPIPSLVSTLLRREQDANRPLTKEEVIAIRDDCTAVIMRKGDEKAVVEKRGYADVDPEDVWAAWQTARKDLPTKKGS
jgi:hypothetical protein